MIRFGRRQSLRLLVQALQYGNIMRKSRVLDCFVDVDEFLRAAQESVASFAYLPKEIDGLRLIAAPGHSVWLPSRSTSPPIRLFRSKHHALNGYEAPSVALFSFILRRCAIETFYDVGAAQGFYSLLAGSTQDHRVVAHGFEIQPKKLEEFEQAVAKADLTGQIFPHFTGLSDTNEGSRTVWISRAQMFETKPKPSQYREAWHRRLKLALRGIWNRDELKEVALNVTSIDTFSGEHQLPEFIKIDVDGYEGRILKGAENVLRTHRPFILLELHQDDHIERTGWNRRSVANYLFDLGYEAVFLTNHHNVDGCEVAIVKRDDGIFFRQATTMLLFY